MNPSRMCFFLMLATFLGSIPQLHAQASSDTLKVLTWNVYMLPAITDWSKQIDHSWKKKRAKGIAEAIKEMDYDVIVWQETFHMRGRNTLKRRLKELYPYQYGPANYKFLSFRTNSGISFFSKFPLKELDEIRYEDHCGIDRMSRKGGYMVEGEWQGNRFQIVGTHLQAACGNEYRHAQCEAIRDELLKPYMEEGVVQFVMGDMNIAKSDKEGYQKMLEILSVENAPLAGKLQSTSSGGKEIDYVLIRPNGSSAKVVHRQVKVFTHPWSEEDNWLSDHHAVEAYIVFE